MFRRKFALLLIFVILTSLISPKALANTSSSGAVFHDLSGRVIILDPGHGIGSTNVFRGYDEQVAMLDLALRIKPLLEARGATVLMTRPTGANVTLPARTAMINIWALEALLAEQLRLSLEHERNISESPEQKVSFLQRMSENLKYPDADVYEILSLIDVMQSIIDNPRENATIFTNTPFDPERTIHPYLQRIFELQDNPLIADNFLVISLHSNATARPINTSVHGAMVFHISTSHPNTRTYFSGFSHEARSRNFAITLLEHIEQTGFHNLGPRRGNFFILREHNVPAVLAENGFHTNDADRARLMNPQFMERLAIAYVEAITEYFASARPAPAHAYEIDDDFEPHTYE